MSAEGDAARKRLIDPQIALDLLARHMWIAFNLDRGEDGVDAAESWDDDALLTDTYERFGTMAREAVMAETKRREDEQRAAGYDG